MGDNTGDDAGKNVEPAVDPVVEPAVDPVVEPAVEPAVTNESNPFLGIGFALVGSLCFAISATQIRGFGKDADG